MPAEKFGDEKKNLGFSRAKEYADLANISDETTVPSKPQIGDQDTPWHAGLSWPSERPDTTSRQGSDHADPSTTRAELVSDIERLGAAAAAEDVRVAKLLNEPNPSPNLADPTGAESIHFHQRMGEPYATRLQRLEADKSTLAALQNDMAILGNSEDPNAAIRLDKYITARLSEFSKTIYNNGHVLKPDEWSNPWGDRKTSADGIMDGSLTSPFLDHQRGTETWSQWYAAASDATKMNFAQWYGDRLRKLSSPDSREQIENEVKTRYTGLVEKAVRDGWIDEKHLSTVHDRVEQAQIEWFSPWGKPGEKKGGEFQSRLGLRDLIQLPIPVGESISTHELGHSFAGIESSAIHKYFGTERKKADWDGFAATDTIQLILNEGFNDHMVAALLVGAPEIISPAERAAQGIPEARGAAEAYMPYREVFAALVAGDKDNEPLRAEDIKQIVDTMANRDFQAFADFVAKRWHGQDILQKTFDLVKLKKSGSNSFLPTEGDDPYLHAKSILKLLDESR